MYRDDSGQSQSWVLVLGLAASVLAHAVLLSSTPWELEAKLQSTSGGQSQSFTLQSFKARQPVTQEESKPVEHKSVKRPERLIKPVERVVKRIVPPTPKVKQKLELQKPVKTAQVDIDKPVEIVSEPENLLTPKKLHSQRNEAQASGAALERDMGLPVITQAQFRSPPPAPRYPKLALKRRQSGEVLVRVMVAATGQIVTTKVVRSSGFKLLDQAALNSVSRWQFEPWRLDGIAQRSWIEVPVDFTIKRR